MTDFLRGAAWPFRGLAFLAVRPGLWPWVAAPALLAVVLVYLAWIASWAWAPVMLHAVWPQPATPGFVRNLWNGTAFVLIVWAFATFVMLLHGFVGVLGTPFYDRLSQRVEAIARPAEAEPFAWRVFVVDIGWSALHSVQALGLWQRQLTRLADTVCGSQPSVRHLVLGLHRRGELCADGVASTESRRSSQQ